MLKCLCQFIATINQRYKKKRRILLNRLFLVTAFHFERTTLRNFLKKRILLYIVESKCNTIFQKSGKFDYLKFYESVNLESIKVHICQCHFTIEMQKEQYQDENKNKCQTLCMNMYISFISKIKLNISTSYGILKSRKNNNIHYL